MSNRLLVRSDPCLLCLVIVVVVFRLLSLVSSLLVSCFIYIGYCFSCGVYCIVYNVSGI